MVEQTDAYIVGGDRSIYLDNDTRLARSDGEVMLV